MGNLIFREEACLKYCPFKSHIRFSLRRWRFETMNTPCLGTRCMGWRDAKPTFPGERRGYCGLAGKPEWPEYRVNKQETGSE